MKSCAYIVIDSGYSLEVLQSSNRIIGAWDLSENRRYEAKTDYLSLSQQALFAGDPMGHGSIVVSRLLRIVPDAQLILVKAFGDLGARRTVWDNNGNIARPGWSESYVWAAELAKSRDMVSVANCSFGGFWHAVDGTGWEAMQVGRYSGEGKPGHAVIAAAGVGDGRPIHGAMNLLVGESKSFITDQDGTVEYNFWFGLGQEHSADCLWTLEAWRDGQLVNSFHSHEVPGNMWNDKEQLKFFVYGGGRVQFELRRTDYSDRQVALRVDAWAEAARFRNWVSPELIGEPACYPGVIAVGLDASTYSPTQREPGRRPHVMLPGSDQLSFRLPEVVAATGALLEQNPELDLPQIKSILGKYPDTRKVLEACARY